MKLVYRFLFLSLCACFFFVLTIQAQDRTDRKHHHDFFQKVDRAYQQGDITIDQKVLYKFFPAEAKGKIKGDWDMDPDHPIKCGTPAISDFHRLKSKLSAATVSRVQSVLNENTMQASETYQSPNGHFTIHYETTGSHAVPSTDNDSDGVPDYVEEVAAAADSSYRHEVQRLGYTDPIVSGTYDIEIVNMVDIYGFSYYGVTSTDNGSTFIQIENDFAEGFPPNDDPEGNQIGAVKVTAAHEFKHAIQYEANNWQYETGGWLEMDATLMEEAVYDNVNDYYNYLESSTSIFNNPQYGFYSEDFNGNYFFNPGQYNQVSWALFFEEKFGSQFWVDVWETIKNNPTIAMIDAITQQLGSSEAFIRNFTESQLWHFTSGANTIASYGFEESAEYPTPFTRYNFVGDDSLAAPDTLRRLSASYYDIQPSPFSGSVAFNFSDIESPSAGFGVIAYFNDGRTEPLILFNDQQQTITYETNWRWEDIDRLGIIAANSSSQKFSTYGLSVRSVDPQMVRLEQNYPNPFSDQTTIRYSITEQKDVQLEIFDVLGRKVATLVDGTQPEGIYPELFTAEGLASGVYFYRLIIDGEVTTKKMTLIK